ncbi:CAP domain-containing protein [Nocardioides albidus]|uniref:CAP domain-containing protein n=1 Tax=Nocardioides albidus TaxID=1517589 RepID=A0A5C4VS75_9ACTN|nr:CAP domain-containing protein [Nocardioides albidus]TNM38376.1 CAP domain-containing protein [Nocardioides albidus]
MRRVARSALAAAAATAALTATAAHAPPAHAQEVTPMDDGYEDAVLQTINQRRAHRGLRLLRTSSCVDPVAERRSRRMGVNDEMRHYDGLRRVLRRCGGSRVGEIIARGPGFSDPRAVVRAWMHSPSHRALIEQRGFRAAAVGAWRDAGGEVFVSVVFRSP